MRSDETSEIVDVQASIVLEEQSFELTDIDEVEAQRHLEAVGFGEDDPCILACYGSTSRYVPARNLKKDLPYDWDQVVARFNGDRRFDLVRHHLQDPKTQNLGFLSAIGGTSKRRDTITGVTCMSYEIDEGLDLEGQKVAWKKAELPPPTISVFTGNRSIHHSWVFRKPVSVTAAEFCRKRLSKAIEDANPGVQTDHNLHSAVQVQRLAGSVHPKTGRRAEIIHLSPHTYELDEVLSFLPEMDEPVDDVTDSGGDFRPADGPEPDDHEQFPDFSTLPPVQLTQALGPKTRDLLRGLDPESDDRWRKCWQLSKHLRAARLHLESLGCTVVDADSIERTLMSDFISHSGMKGGDVEAALEEHYRPEPCGTSDYCDTYLKRKLRAYFERQGLWRPSYGWHKRLVPASNPDDWTANIDDSFWTVCRNKTCEVVIENAIGLKGDLTNQPLAHSGGRFVRYSPDQGCWLHVSRDAMKREVADLLLKCFSYNKHEEKVFRFSTAARVKSSIEWLETMTADAEMDQTPAIAFANGTYLIDKGELVPHKPEYRLTYSIQGDFIPDCVECPPNLHDFIVSSFGDHYVEPVQQLLRYMVDPTLPNRKIVMVIGPSGSGKGVLERLIEKLFPPSCVSSITSSIKEINSPEKIRQYVSGKQLVAFPDVQGLQTGVTTIYSMVDGGLMAQRNLFTDDTEGVVFTGRVVICSSQAPQFENAGSGMARRALILETQRPAEKLDADLDQKLAGELGSIVSWALQAQHADVKRVLVSGNQTFIDAQHNVEADMDVVRQFLDNCCEPCGGDYMPKLGVLYETFKQFCEDFGYSKVLNRRTLLTRIKQALPNLHTQRRSVPGTNSTKKVNPQLFGFRIRPEVDAGGRWDKRNYREGNWAALSTHKAEAPTPEQVFEHQRLSH
ncbi:primase-like DNA-binding domain-containing protein [bacterium]|nr:primase-like DNA-binding domain-containing protein [bacterium]